MPITVRALKGLFEQVSSFVLVIQCTSPSWNQ